jgi:hypothetical protein
VPSTEDWHGAIVLASRHGHPYARFHIVEVEQAGVLTKAAEHFDYVSAYSLVDLGPLPRFSVDQKWSQLLRLDGSAEELLEGFHKKVRQQVRRAYRDEGTVVVVDDHARDESLAFYRAIKEEDGAGVHIEEDFSSVIWINGYVHGQLVAASSWFDSGTALRCHHSMSTRKQEGVDPAQMSRLNRLLMWEGCRLAEQLDRRYVDLAGIDLQDPAKHGLAEFKLGFGGETVPVHIYRFATPAWDEVVAQAKSEGREIP